MIARAATGSLTLRLALLYAGSTLLILLAVGLYLLGVIDRHFVEQDRTELRGKLELASRLVERAGGGATLERLLDDALVGHHHLSLAVVDGGRRRYRFGAAEFAPGLLAQPATALAQAPLHEWHDAAGHHRGLVLALPGGPVIAVATETGHHREFVADFQLALWSVVALALAVAAALGWLAARLGLAPLAQTARLAREISAERLHLRLPADQVPPELQDLAASFNAMLDRLAEAIQRLSGFAADLAHEMRTPVNNLMMQTQVTLSQTRSADAYREVLLSNLEEFERLARTIGDMLFLAKADNGLIVPTREPVDLGRELAELTAFYEALADDRGVRLRREGGAVVVGDRLMLRRALSNLLSNAVRYTPEGSEVRITLAQHGAGVQLRTENPCPHPPEPLDGLFDRFRRGATSDGAGLGLAITRSIARAHGGDVTAAAHGGVIRFALDLPGDAVANPPGAAPAA